MTELFEGDYAFVISEYDGACATGRSRHDGGGFVGTLHQETEMIMCCHTDDTGFNEIARVLEGQEPLSGNFRKYGRFEDPRGSAQTLFFIRSRLNCISMLTSNLRVSLPLSPVSSLPVLSVSLFFLIITILLHASK